MHGDFDDSADDNDDKKKATSDGGGNNLTFSDFFKSESRLGSSDFNKILGAIRKPESERQQGQPVDGFDARKFRLRRSTLGNMIPAGSMA